MLNIIIVIFVTSFIYIVYQMTQQKSNYNYNILFGTLILIILFIIIIYFLHKGTEFISVKSVIDEKYYNVMNKNDKKNAANMLALISKKLNQLSEYLYNNKHKFENYSKYLDRLHERLPKAKIAEGENDGVYTSYSVNKGDELIFCLRSIKNKDEMHDINLLMYVALHEIAHIACPDIGHDELFVEIFEFITKQAMEIGLYKKIDFNNLPTEYCGLVINGSVV